MPKHGCKGTRRPVTPDEERRIIYYFQNAEEPSIELAARRFQRHPQRIKDVLQKYRRRPTAR
jgi:hypothetical protein